jgi:hypothetical protein
LTSDAAAVRSKVDERMFVQRSQQRRALRKIAARCCRGVAGGI